MDMVTTFVLGFVQGLTEFIPVSSSGHLVIFEHLFGQADHMFINFINIGTLLALLVYYRTTLASIYKDITKNHNYKLARNILLTSIPAGLAGLAFSHVIDTNPFFTNIYVVITALVVVGVVMIVLERLPRAAPVEDGAHLSWQKALGIGVAQTFALIPGVSRSGSTIIASRLSGLSSGAAADYSFLASIPIMLALTLKLFIGSSDRQYLAAHLPQLIVGNIVAFIVGLLAINFLLTYLKKHGLQAFGWYRIIAATVLLLALSM